MDLTMATTNQLLVELQNRGWHLRTLPKEGDWVEGPTKILWEGGADSGREDSGN